MYAGGWCWAASGFYAHGLAIRGRLAMLMMGALRAEELGGQTSLASAIVSIFTAEP